MVAMLKFSSETDLEFDAVEELELAEDEIEALNFSNSCFSCAIWASLTDITYVFNVDIKQSE